MNAETVESLLRDAGLGNASAVLFSLASDGPPIALRTHSAVYPASMIKVPLAAAVLAMLPAERTLEMRIPITPCNMTVNDAPSPLVPGYESTLRELLELAIRRSDNVATNQLYDFIGRKDATQYVQSEFGLKHTAFHRKLSGSEPLIDDPLWDGVHRNAHPAGDAAQLFAAIARDAIPHAALLREMLEAQEWNDKLSLGLLPGDVFLHKTGDTDEVTHDGGILRTRDGRAYVIVVYATLQSTPEHNARFGTFMREVRALL